MCECNRVGRSRRDWDEDSMERSQQNERAAGFVVILRFNQENGMHSISSVKLPLILNKQVGKIKKAKVLSDGDLLITC